MAPATNTCTIVMEYELCFLHFNRNRDVKKAADGREFLYAYHPAYARSSSIHDNGDSYRFLL